MSLTIQRVTVPQRKRLSELGYTNDDIKDLQQNPQKLNQIIEKGTVKTGATDQQIARQQAKDLKIKNRAIRTRDANQEHVTKWLAKLKKQGINISESTLREAIQSGDVKKYLGSKGISAGGGNTTIPWGVINSMENVINYETKYGSKQETDKNNNLKINNEVTPQQKAIEILKILKQPQEVSSTFEKKNLSKGDKIAYNTTANYNNPKNKNSLSIV